MILLRTLAKLHRRNVSPRAGWRESRPRIRYRAGTIALFRNVDFPQRRSIGGSERLNEAGLAVSRLATNENNIIRMIDDRARYGPLRQQAGTDPAHRGGRLESVEFAEIAVDVDIAIRAYIRSRQV